MSSAVIHARRVALVMLGVILGIAGYIAVSDGVFGSGHGDAEVRVATRSLDDGRVEVAVQQRAADADWSARQLPDARFLSADVEPGTWRVSSGVPISAADADGGSLLCIVTHGATNDFFWRAVKGWSRQASIDAGLNVRFRQAQDGAQQASQIEQCSVDGASVIAATLADPDAVRDALLAAKAAGARIITFNSGAEYAASVGSEMHIALDDRAAGRLVGEAFNTRGISGAIGCLLHEENNVGLITRCEALAATYTGGDVINIRLPEGGDRAAMQASIEERLLDVDDAPLAALVSLNSDTLNAALHAILATADQMEQTVQLTSVGGSLDVTKIPAESRSRHISFHVSAAPEVQGYLVTAALQMVHNHTTPARFIGSPTILIAEPRVLDLQTARADPQAAKDTLGRLAERIALGDQYDE